MAEFNIDDVKEIRRITALELNGTLDEEGLKAFVEVLWPNSAVPNIGVNPYINLHINMDCLGSPHPFILGIFDLAQLATRYPY